MSRMTPPMNVSGAFILRAPFTIDSNASYTVVALRKFEELIARKQDPLTLVYTPVGLGPTAYAEDQLEEAEVVCLRNNKTGAMMYVPDTYIESYPNMGSVKYSRLVIGVSLGMFPDSRDLTDVKQSIIESVKAKIGVDVELFVGRSTIANYVTEQEHAQITAARRSAVTNTETTTAQIIRLSDTIAMRDTTIEAQRVLIEALTAKINEINGNNEATAPASTDTP